MREGEKDSDREGERAKESNWVKERMFQVGGNCGGETKTVTTNSCCAAEGGQMLFGLLH